ncbi:MAG TPA: phage portal protein [Actinomycetota bacterium]|nr:phage portal protein [Actinomycetota bacterium]
MSLLGELLGARKSPGRHPSDPVVAEWFSSHASETAAGVRVSPESALRLSAVYACVSLIAETIGSLPAHLLLEDGRFRRRAVGHPLERTLTERANPEMEAGEFWEQMVGWKLVRGNALAWIETARDGTVALWPIPWHRVRVARTSSGRLAYLLRLTAADHVGSLPAETEVALLQEEVLHIRNWGLGPVGLSPIAQAAEAIGLASAAEEYGARFFAQDARPGGYLKVPGNMDEQTWAKLRARWRELHEGAKRAHVVGLLEGGMDWVKVGVSPEEAQFLELRRFQVADIARMFRVPPHMIGDVERSTSWGSGIEQQGIGFVTYTLRTHLTRLERVVRTRLLAAEPGLFLRWNVSGLLRGDVKSRHEAYAIGRQWGWLSVNDIRALEDMDPVEGGDAYLQPLNMAPIVGPNGQGAAAKLVRAVTGGGASGLDGP